MKVKLGMYYKVTNGYAKIVSRVADPVSLGRTMYFFKRYPKIDSPGCRNTKCSKFKVCNAGSGDCADKTYFKEKVSKLTGVLTIGE